MDGRVTSDGEVDWALVGADIEAAGYLHGCVDIPVEDSGSTNSAGRPLWAPRQPFKKRPMPVLPIAAAETVRDAGSGTIMLRKPQPYRLLTR